MPTIPFAFEALAKLTKESMPAFCAAFLKITDKSGRIVPLELNKAQLYAHSRLEQQRKTLRRVRAIILKGRQQGLSTYVAGRFIWRMMMSEAALSALVMAHLSSSTNNLFRIVRRYIDYFPDQLKPSLANESQRELIFEKTSIKPETTYGVATAGSKGVGRGFTGQLFHGSEFAFWENPEEHFSGILQSVGNVDGTEIILESTANSVGDEFHQRWQQAEMGQGDYIPIFVPWFWEDGYQIADTDYEIPPELIEYAEYYNITREQMAWRHAKILEFKGDEKRFKRDYPADAAEAFSTASDRALISVACVNHARQAVVGESTAPVILGVDPARFGNDRTAFCLRQGRKVHWVKFWQGIDTMQTVGEVINIVRSMNIARVFIDVCGLGAGVYDRLNEMGYSEMCKPVNSAERSLYPDRYANKRAEIWCEMRDWFEQEADVEIPDDDALVADIVAPYYDYDSSGRIKIEKKEDMAKRGVRSPDLADALALTFAQPVTTNINNYYVPDNIGHDMIFPGYGY